MRERLLACGVVLALSLAAPAARAASPIPDFPVDGVAVSGVHDGFAALREHLARTESRVGAQYVVCVVRFSESRNRAGVEYSRTAVPYADRVAEAWQGSLDPAAHVLICMAVDNRGIAIHPGSRWTALGFEAADITKVIEESPFARTARSGDIAGALERLVDAVDLHLSLRVQSVEQAAVRVREDLAAYGRDIATRREAAQTAGTLTTAVQARLAAASAGVQAAALRLDGGDVTGAERELRGVHAALADVRSATEAATRAQAERARIAAELVRIRAAAPAELGAARTRLASIREQVEAAPREPEGAANLAVVARTLDEAEQQLVAGDPRDAVRRARTADDLLDGIEASVAEAHEMHTFYTFTLPLIAGGALLAVLLLLAFIHTMVRGAARSRALLAIERWRKLLGRGSTRLVAMRDEHPFLFGSQRLEQRFTGATAAQFRTMGEAADDLFLTYGAAANQLRRAEAVYDEAPAIGWGNFNLAVRLLDESRVELSREQVGDDRLFLPETRVVTRAAAELLDHMSDVYENVYAKVHALEAELVEVPEILSGALDALTAAEDALSELRKRGVNVGVFERLHDGHRAQHETLRHSVEHDPIGVRAEATSLQGAAETLMARLRRVRSARDVLDETLDGRLAALRDRISQHRAEGLRLTEPGFEPERMVGAAQDAGAAALARAADGEDQAALNAAHEARDTVAEMERLVEASLASRDATPGQLGKLRDEEQQQRRLLGERAAKIDALLAEHDERAIVPALDNADEAGTALDFVAGCIDEGRAALADDAQRFLAAAELARRALHVLADVTDLYGEIDRKGRELTETRHGARQTLTQALRRVEDLTAFMTADGHFASEATAAAAATLAQSAEDERAAQAAERPHWPERLAAANALLAHEKSVRAVAEEEHRARDAARALSEGLEKAYRDTETLLRSSTDDRPPANRRMADAAALLGRAGREEGAAHPDWGAIVALLTDARQHVEEAKRMTREDIALADATRRTIGEAHDAINDADRSFGHGVRARLGAARKELRRARNALAVQQYETARKIAEEARMKAADARRAAVSAARRKAAVELTRALASAAGVAATSRRASWKSGASRSSWKKSSGSSGSSSWSGGFGSSSGKSSFGGGRRSGGSRSGGSSFGGSSSGGSSW